MRVCVINVELFIILVALPGLLNAEFFSDVDSEGVDSKERDEAKALEIKATGFWRGLMKSAQGLETAHTVRLIAKAEKEIKALTPKDNDIRELLEKAVVHLGKADAMLFEEASRSKMLALQRLHNGPSEEAFADFVSQFQNSFVVAVNHFVGKRNHGYGERLAKHVISRLKDVQPTMHSAADMAPKMLDESQKAAECAEKVVIKAARKDHHDIVELARDIMSATGKQRSRFNEYLFNSLLTTADDVASKDEKATATVMKASFRGVQSEPVTTMAENKPSTLADPEPPLVFFDGVPVGAEPVLVF